jgi:AAA domain
MSAPRPEVVGRGEQLVIEALRVDGSGKGRGRSAPGRRRSAAVGEIGAAPERTRTAFLPADELLARTRAEPDWIWEHALARGAVTLLAGKPKAGKSTLTYGLVAAVANDAETFLGRTVRGGRVVYASEEGLATLGSTFPRHPDIYLATRETAWPKPTWRYLIADAAEAVRQASAAVAVIDTFSFWNGLGPDAEKDAGSVQPLIDALVEITRTGCAIWLPAHHRKSGGEDGDAIRGTTAIAGGVDCFCELEKIKNAPASQRRLVITPRWTAPPLLVLDYSEETGYRRLGQAADREGSAAIGWTERLLEAIPETGDGVTLADLAGKLGEDRRKWHPALRVLLDDERVQRTGKGSKGDPYRHLQQTVPSCRPADRTESDGSRSPVLPSCRIHTASKTETADRLPPSRTATAVDREPHPSEGSSGDSTPAAAAVGADDAASADGLPAAFDPRVERDSSPLIEAALDRFAGER